MTSVEKIERDIATLKDSLELNKMNMHELSRDEVQQILVYTGKLKAELEILEKQLREILA